MDRISVLGGRTEGRDLAVGRAPAAWLALSLELGSRKLSHIDRHVILFKDFTTQKLLHNVFMVTTPDVEPNSSTTTSNCWCVFRKTCSALAAVTVSGMKWTSCIKDSTVTRS